jgi:hypothetical protein
MNNLDKLLGEYYDVNLVIENIHSCNSSMTLGHINLAWELCTDGPCKATTTGIEMVPMMTTASVSSHIILGILRSCDIQPSASRDWKCYFTLTVPRPSFPSINKTMDETQWGITTPYVSHWAVWTIMGWYCYDVTNSFSLLSLLSTIRMLSVMERGHTTVYEDIRAVRALPIVDTCTDVVTAVGVKHSSLVGHAIIRIRWIIALVCSFLGNTMCWAMTYIFQ